MDLQFSNLVELLDHFKDEPTCVAYLELQRWNNQPVCPYCNHQKVYRTNRGFKCANNDCHKKFSVLVGSIFENTKVSLRLWFAAIYLCTGHKKGISSLQLSKDIGVTQPTAWFMLHRIREMLKEEAPEALQGTIEVDETFVGGKNKNRHKDKKVPHSQGRSYKDKTPVLGILEREVSQIITRPHKIRPDLMVNEKQIIKPGKVRYYVVSDTQQASIQPIIEKNVQADATIYSDEWWAYRDLCDNYNHAFVNHAVGQYANGDVTTNRIENTWATFKRGINGIYHSVSRKHLHRYGNEFAHRYNTRHFKDAEKFQIALRKVDEARLLYKVLISKPAKTED